MPFLVENYMSKDGITMFVYNNFPAENPCITYIQFDGDEQTGVRNSSDIRRRVMLCLGVKVVTT